MTSRGQLHVWYEGPTGRILTYTRPNGRCPAREFLDDAPKHLRARFDRSFGRFGSDGMNIADHKVFKPLSDEGKGIWSFKEHDHRLLAFRGPDENEGNGHARQQIVLLCGWTKDKSESLEERTQARRATALRQECESSVDWSDVNPNKPRQDALACLRDDLADPLLCAIPVPDGVSAETVAAVIPVLVAQEGRQAAKGPAQTPRKRPLPPVPLPPVPLPLPSKPKPSYASLRDLAELTEVPYKWLWRVIKEGLVEHGACMDGRQCWPWEGIEKVVAQVEAARKTGGQGRSRKAKPILGKGLEGEPLLRLSQAARLAGVSRKVFRSAISAGKIRAATVRDGSRLFRGSDVHEWRSTLLPSCQDELKSPQPTTKYDVDTFQSVPEVVPVPVETIQRPRDSPPPVLPVDELVGWLESLLAGQEDDFDAFIVVAKAHRERRVYLQQQMESLGLTAATQAPRKR